jgi:hypothetical protein
MEFYLRCWEPSVLRRSDCSHGNRFYSLCAIWLPDFMSLFRILKQNSYIFSHFHYGIAVGYEISFSIQLFIILPPVSHLVARITINVFEMISIFRYAMSIKCSWPLTVNMRATCSTEVHKLWGAPSGGAVGPLEGSSCLYEAHIYFERNIGPG